MGKPLPSIDFDNMRMSARDQVITDLITAWTNRNQDSARLLWSRFTEASRKLFLTMATRFRRIKEDDFLAFVQKDEPALIA